MITKIAWYSAKGKLKDYFILFSGLMIASSTFYVFQSLAQNTYLFNKTTSASSFSIIFQLVSILLGTITLFYLIYANTFLMNMKQKTYGMMMLLGANKLKIIYLNLLETIGIGVVATLTGSFLGIFVSNLLNFILKKSLKETFITKALINWQAFLVTFIFFVLCFTLTSFLNGKNLVKKQLIDLMKQESIPEHKEVRLWILIVEFLFGLSCISLGYYGMYRIMDWKTKSIMLGMITVFLGSYFVIHSLIILFLSLLKKRKSFYFTRVNSIFIAQLTYRIRAYTQILTVISILFALALGAITVGIGFKNEGFKISDRSLFYDLVLNQENRKELNEIGQDDIKSVSEYQLKYEEEKVLINKEELKNKPFTVNGPINSEGNLDVKYFDALAIAKDELANQSFRKVMPKKLRNKKISVVSQHTFDLSNGRKEAIILVKMKDFKKIYPKLENIVQRIGDEENSNSLLSSNQKVNRYKGYEKGLLIFEYIGIFLGIAFLTMLTSCLMFKILSGYKIDQKRYEILTKIGVTKKDMKGVVRKELFVVFAFPALLGTLHVVFGLQMFKMLLTNPYDSIVTPIISFILVYFLYFYLTFRMYLKIIGSDTN